MMLRHLEILEAIAETGNFTKVAEILYITQSTASHAAKELEEEAGTLLFERLKKCVRITESGHMLLEESLPLLPPFQALEGRLGRLKCQAPIRIVPSITTASWRPPDIPNRFQEKWPKLPVQVEVQNAVGALQVLGAGGMKPAFLEGAPPVGSYACTPFSPYALSLVCSPALLERRKPGILQGLHACPLPLREKGSVVRGTFNSFLYLREPTPTPSWTSVNSGVLMETARAGLGIAVLLEGLVRPELGMGVLAQLYIPGLTLTNPMSVIYHKEKYITALLKDLLLCVNESKQS